MVVVGLIGEVFKVHAQERIQQLFMEQNTLKFQFLKVVVFKEVFSVLPRHEFSYFIRSLWCCG